MVETEDRIKTISGTGTNLRGNNTAELYSAVQSLKTLVEPSKVTLRTDSMFVLQVYEALEEYAAKKFMKTKRRIMKDYELLKSFWILCRKHEITMIHIKGHSGDFSNCMADKLATHARKNALKALPNPVIRPPA